METITAFLTLCAGVFVRLALPITITLLLVYFLRKLDARWQAEADLTPISIQKPECWKIKGCSPEQRKDCMAFNSPLPCWQVFRLPNGYLSEKCTSCKVFINAPVSTLPSTASTSKLEG